MEKRYLDKGGTKHRAGNALMSAKGKKSGKGVL
jgi:hypothetical protein